VVSSTGTQLSGDGRFVVSYDPFFAVTEVSDRFSRRGMALPIFVSSPAISDNVQYIVGTDGSGKLIMTPNPLAP
jgi:hypothetical protein